MDCYSKAVVRHPILLIVANIVVALTLGLVMYFMVGLPDFSDPMLGLEPRSSKVTIWEKTAAHVFEGLKNGSLRYSPRNYTDFVQNATASGLSSRKRRAVLSEYDIFLRCVDDAVAYLDISDPRFIVTSRTGSNIFTANQLHSICRLQDAIENYSWPKKSCNMTSLPLYVAALANKTSCHNVTDSDVAYVIMLLQRCSTYYFDGRLTPYCHLQNTCPTVPQQCGYLNAVYAILHVLTDIGFMKDGNANLTELHFSVIVLPHSWFYRDQELVFRYYLDTFEDKVVEEGDITIPALYMDIDNKLFTWYIQHDLVLFGLAMAMVVIVLLFYLQSVVLMLAVVMNVLGTLSISYFIYYYVLQLHFFPFMNLLAAILLIAITADDVFIIHDFWHQEAGLSKDNSYEKIMSETLRKGGLSIFVTSLTTAASLLANIANKITAIRCFGVFAGVCILLNFVLMIMCIPALILLIDKTTKLCVAERVLVIIRKGCEKLSRISDYFWGTIMTKIITKASLVWIVLFLLVGVLGLVAVFAKPKLRYPDTNYLRLFRPSDLLEQYKLQYRDRIRFENESRSRSTIDITFLWGVKGADNGDIWDATKQGTLEFAPVDVYSPEVISWQNKFCDKLKMEPFVSEIYRQSDCFFETIDKLLHGPCQIQPINRSSRKEVNLSPCCEVNTTVNRTMRERCIVYYAKLSGGYLRRLTDTEVLGEVILDRNNDIKIFSYTFKSTAVQTPSFVYMNDFYKQIEKFTTKQLSDAPEVLKDGWFASYIGSLFLFYDVQKEVAAGTITGIGLSLTCSFVVLLATSLNLLISLYAIVTITMIIGATVGSLVFLGWELNVTESLTITMSLGLAVDFTIHYGVTYKLSNSSSRAERVQHTVTSVCSAVSMAALTTFVSGVSVLGARVHAYRQFGTFLVFVMFYSWIFSTFFFLPLCYHVGPLGNTGNIAYLFRCCCPSRNKLDLRTAHENLSCGKGS